MTDSRPFASLAMYPLPWLAPAWARLWSLVSERAPWLPAALVGEGDAHDHWGDPACTVAQMCGWPAVTARHDEWTIAGAFTLALDGADGHRYRSVLVAARPIDPAAAPSGELTAAANAPDSLSGWVSLLAAIVGAGNPWPGPVRWTGSHLASLCAVRDGTADIASLDALTLAYVGRDRPAEVRGIVEVGRGPWVPSLPLVARRGTPAADRIDELRAAVAAVLASPASAEVRETLLLTGFTALDDSEYTPLLALRPGDAVAGTVVPQDGAVTPGDPT